VFITNRLRCREISLCASDCFEDEEIYTLSFDINSKPHKYRFILIYRRPRGGEVGSDAANKLCSIMTRHAAHDGPVFILGDLNCPHIDWSFGRPPSVKCELPIYEFFQSNGFSQCVNESTRGNNTLDVLCTNEPILVSNISVQPPFVNSDHDSVEFDLLFSCDPNVNASETEVLNNTAKHYLWSKGDYEAMSEFLINTDWSELFMANLTPDTIWSAFCEVLDNAIDNFVPAVDVKPRKNTKTRSYPRHIRNLIARKLAAWKAYKTDRSDPKAKSRYSELQADLREAIKKHEIYMEKKVINSNSVENFYKHVNKRMSARSSIGVLTTPGGEVAETDADKANLLNGYFGSVCTQDDGSNPPFTPPAAAADGEGLSSVSFDEFKLLAAVRRIKTKCPTSSGPDGYPVIMLRNTIGSIAQPLSQMFNSFMSVGKLPSEWKTAHVTPFYKKGQSSDPANYRPISQTSIFCKLLERVVVADVTAYLLRKGLINKHQHGFVNGRSTTTNLLESLSDWTFAIDNKATQTVIYVDFSKAFDSVSHPKLITKLTGYGIYGELLQLIINFLSDRVQKTRVGNCMSSSVNLTSGVIQGSCLGPLLFLIFINDLAAIFDPSVTPQLYADDLKLYTSVASDVDNERLQQNLDQLVRWAHTWQLNFSIKKCQSIHLCKSYQSDTMPANTLYIDSNPLPVTDTAADLGVVVDAELKFSTHISRMVHKAHTRSKLLWKSFVSRDRNTLVKAFVVYIRPMLEYCSAVWSPHLVKDIELIEAVQRRFTKYLPGLYDVSYKERLRIVGLERLDVRRLFIDLVTAYKIIFGHTGLNSKDFFQLNHEHRTRGHNYKLSVPQVSSDTRKYFFSVRIIHVWNDLPSDKTDFTCLRNFKTSIRKIDLSKYCIELK